MTLFFFHYNVRYRLGHIVLRRISDYGYTKRRTFSRLLRHARDTEDCILDSKPRRPHGGHYNVKYR